MKKDKKLVQDMFDSIAPRYDFLNHMLTMGIDKKWRRKVAVMISEFGANAVLDLATGTGDLAIAIAKKSPKSTITAVDMSSKMLDIAKAKIAKLGFQQRIVTELQDALCMTFEDNIFDALTISFGVRNFENLDEGLSEMLRVVKPSGKLIIMEVSRPCGVMAIPYMFYFKRVLPFIGKMVSKNNFAYTYLPKSAVEFPCGSDFVSIMERVGYRDVKCVRLLNGVAMIYSAIK